MSMSSKQKAAGAVTISLIALGGGTLMLGRDRLKSLQIECEVKPYSQMTGEQHIVVDFADGKWLTLTIKPGEPLPVGKCSLHFALRAKLGVPIENLLEAVFSDRINRDLKIIDRRVDTSP